VPDATAFLLDEALLFAGLGCERSSYCAAWQRKLITSIFSFHDSRDSQICLLQVFPECAGTVQHMIQLCLKFG
jgi:hypothetical protein